jgi:hypothetical protein
LPQISVRHGDLKWRELVDLRFGDLGSKRGGEQLFF